MSRWAEPVKEFHQLVTPDGTIYDLHTASRNGRWVMNSQGWGMPGVDWITQQSPFQHGASVMDYRLTPRMIQLMVRQNFCTRDQYWAGREALINALRPNRTPISFTDYWLPRSQYQGGGIYPSGDDQTDTNDLAVFNDLLYGCSGTDVAGTGGLLLVWDGSGSWVNAAAQASVTDGVTTEYATGLESLLSASMLVPVFSDVLASESICDFYDTDDDSTDTIYGAVIVGQTFTTTQEYILSRVRLKLSGSGLPATIHVAVHATDGGGHPTGEALTASTMNAQYVTTDLATGAWYDFGGTPLSTGWSVPNTVLSSGVKYAIVVRMPEGTVANHLHWYRDITAPAYAGGNQEDSADDGGSWILENSDMMFEVFGRTWVTGKVGEETRELLLAGGYVDGIVVPWDAAWQTTMGAFQFGAENTIWDMLQWDYDGNVYCATGGTGLLLKYSIDLTTGRGSLVSCAAHLTENNVYCLAVYDDGGGEDIYGGTSGGTLVRWNGAVGGTWTTVCSQANGDQTEIWDLAVHNGYLYGCTGPDGYLVRYDVGAGHWDVVTTSLATDIKALLVFKGRLYGSGQDGHLYRWNDDDDWETICAEYVGDGGLTEEIQCMIGFNGRLMAGTSAGAYLLEWIRKRTYNQPQCTALRRLLSNGQRRDLCVFIAEGPKFDVDEPGWDEHGFTEMLRFIAYDPTMYDPDMVTVAYLLGTGLISEYEDITYPGTWETHPTLVLTGPLTSPSIINEGIDEFISLDYDIPTGDIVTIDLSHGTIEDNHGINLSGALTADSHFGTFRLVPHPELHDGTNRVRIVAGGATANSDFEMQYYTRFVGI